MRTLFEVHKLSPQGAEKAQAVANNFDAFLSKLEALCGADGREMAIVKTKLEECCFFAKKAMASRPENQEGYVPPAPAEPTPAPAPTPTP